MNDWSFPVVSFALLLMLVLSTLYWQDHPLAVFLTASREQVFTHHEYWRLFTTSFIHADVLHFLSNSIFFFIFGILLNGYFGSWAFPILSFFMGTIVNGMVLFLYPEHSVLMGASGVVYSMVGFWMPLFYFIERGQTHTRRLLATIGVSLILFFPTEYQAQVSYLAHGAGFMSGIVTGTAFFFLKRTQIRDAEVWIDEDTQPPSLTPEMPYPLEDHSDSDTVRDRLC